MKNRKLLIWACGILLLGGLALLTYFRLNKSSADSASGNNAAPPALVVKAVKATRGDVQAWVFADGTARATKREYLTFERAGRVIFVRPGGDGGDLREGERVKAGELLVQLDPRQDRAELGSSDAALTESKTRVIAATAELAQANTQKQLAEAGLERMKQLRAAKASTEVEYDEGLARVNDATAAVARAESQLEASQAGVNAAQAKLSQSGVALERTELRSPINGIVAYINIKKGYYFNPSAVRMDSESAWLQTVPMVIIDPSRYEIQLDVPFYDGDRIKIGQAARLVLAEDFRAAAVGGAKEGNRSGTQLSPSPGYARASGKVFSVNPAVNPGARSIQVKIRTSEGAENLRDGMFVTAWIATNESRQTVLVPFNAIVYRQNKPLVFVIDPKSGTVVERAVELGLQGLAMQEIKSGVSVGDTVVTDGRLNLVQGAPVKPIIEAEEKMPKPASAGVKR